MENIHIEGSHDVFFVPTVDFNAETGVCEISGESYLEETIEFYTPLLEWLENYIAEIDKPITLNIKLTYFNTSSSRCILDILNILKDYEEAGGKVTVNWFYDVEDSDMVEEVEDYMIDSELQINMIPFEEDENMDY
jgi:hypothetical protein